MTTTITRRGGAVRLTLSAKAAGNLELLERSLESLAERLGHPACATGCDILHLAEVRTFTMRDDASLNPQPLPPKDPFSIPDDALQVILPARVNNDINALKKALAVTLDRLGCAACCSGLDIAFRREFDMLALDEELNVEGFGTYR